MAAQPGADPAAELSVAVFGAEGRMGQALRSALDHAPGFRLWAGLGSATPREHARGADVAVDFTHREGALANARWAAEHRIPIVIGTSGLSQDDLAELAEQRSSDGAGCALVVPNFSLSAWLTTRIGALLAEHFTQAEIVEYYGAGKRDSPSATSVALAQAIAGARSTPFSVQDEHARSRGETVAGIPVHAVRLDGYLSREEVYFGMPGESLCVSFETSGREAFMPNVLRAIRAAPSLSGLVVGLDAVLEDGRGEAGHTEGNGSERSVPTEAV